ncbi:ABC transporter permease [Sporosarcina sp. 6E9]|uniref:ABC transporter permease n=1 Tax=Sporosarcina sp. 6E9 TaxID=2819235 RepID=UPI001B307F39|nr:ABC transporter permease [Sporosarcina sp. 6E9]
MTFRQFAYRNVVRNRRIYAAFFMASVFSVMVFFLYSMLLFHPTIEDRFIREIAIMGMGIAEIILFVFTAFFLFYSMRAFLQARSKEFGILLHLGMEKRQINRLIFIETLLIGITSIGIGIILGFTFSKFFFMIVKEIVLLPALPLYLSWKPFVLTIGAFLSLFILISFIAPVFIKSGKIADLIRGDGNEKELYAYSKVKGIIGITFLGVSYAMAAFTSNSIVLLLLYFLPPLATIGTFYFFTDSVPMLLHKLRSSRKFYWRNFRLLSFSEGIVRLRENARMFFIVTIVSTVAFMSVGTLASLTSFASQYREMNPLGLIYISYEGNELEEQHTSMLNKELEENKIQFTRKKIPVLKQRSTYSGSSVDIISVSDINELANAFNHLSIQLNKGQAIFLPPSPSSYKSLNNRTVETRLQNSNLSITIDGAYPHQLFSSYSISTNAIILNDEDFVTISSIGTIHEAPSFTYYAYYIPEWQKTKDIGLSINDTINDTFITGTSSSLSYTFDNPGLNYSIIRTTFSLLLFIGLLLAAVFLLAAGSFIYFRLYTRLEQDRKQFEVLKRLGLTDREFKKIVNRQLIPQFFFPWGVAMLHSSFAFLSLQVVWDALAEISIVKELMLVLIGFTVLQIGYFYLIRWRYLAHIKAPG